MQQSTSHKPASGKTSIILVSILFFLSGVAGLIYQTVWVRLLELYFGVTLTASTLIVAAYMAGLGLGSMLGGRIASRSKNTVLLYGLIEAGIGVFGIFSPTLINWIGQNTAGSPYVLVFVLSFALLLLPTLLMGMTLPLLTQAFVTRVETSGHVIGLLYGINTLGAAFGALVSGYVLMGWFGFSGALLVAAVLNFLVGVSAVLFRTRFEIRPEAKSAKVSAPPRELWNYEAILFSAFLTGFIGMGFEMLWFRLLGVFNKHTAYGFPSILFIFLIALALGGWFWGGRIDNSRDPVRLFWKLQISVGIVTASSFLLMWALINLPQLQPWLKETFNRFQQPQTPFVRIAEGLVLSKQAFVLGLFEYFLPIFLTVLPAGLLMGGGLPSLDRIAIDQVSHSGRRVGDIHLANIIGSVSGTLTTSFILLPALGSELTLKILSALTLSFLAIYLLTQRKLLRPSMVALPAVLILLVILLPGRGEFYTRLYQTAAGLSNVALRESGDGILAITFRGNQTDPADLWIAGIKNSFFPSDGEYERSALTCASVAHPKRILIIGLGGGNTANFITSLPGVEEVVIVELMEELGAFLNEYVPVAQSALNHPAVNYIVDDGRRYLYANPGEKFDMIFIDPLWSFTAGHNNLYSQEAVRLYQSHLSENGVFCAWVNETHFIPKTVATVFPYSDLFDNYLVNSNQALEYDTDYMNQTYTYYIETQSVFLDSTAAETMNPQTILKNLKQNHAKILQSGEGIPALTDLTPWLEYYYACPPRFIRSLHAQQLRYCYSQNIR
ncbi:Polyamine aminopropyltransferase [Anaerolineales bacterium]|nr:Polyamine aminopropyltransferase [Anaerolineales bacterium]